MLVPIEWLKEYVDITIPDLELAKKLTDSGSSVERTHVIGQGLDDLIVAEVLEVAKHPNADRLNVAQVNTGKETIEVVCGALNLAAGQHIVFARPGARVPVNMHDEARGPFVLEEAKIRGVVSHGMICSVAELGIGEDHSGILVLPQDTTVGNPITKELGYPQTVFDIEVTTNRSDQLAMIGLAREVSVLTDTPLNIPEVTAVAGDNTVDFATSINATTGIRLAAQVLDITVGPSPWWMQQRLYLSGMRPINNVVDITNYVMLEYGQPLHAYDLSQIEGQQLQIRMAKANETVITLDSVERTLTSEMMVIADAKKVLSVAGIMGGQASMIGESSKTIVLEAAAFDPVSVRKTANALALRSEASKRFERGVDPETSLQALNRAIELLQKYASASVRSVVSDTYPVAPEAKTVSLSQQKLNQYLGKCFDLAQAEKILQALGFEAAKQTKSAQRPVSSVQKQSPAMLTVSVPSWRLRDVEEDVDLIEEVVRMVGYSSLPITLPAGPLPGHLVNRTYTNRMVVKRLLSQAGWSEALTNSLTNQAETNGVAALAIANPLSSEWTHMRQSVLPGLLEVAQRNSRHGDVRLFELSTVYQPQKQGLPAEEWNLGLVLNTADAVEANFVSVKGIIEEVLAQLGIEPNLITYVLAKQANTSSDMSNTAAIQLNDKLIGFVGPLTDQAANSLDLQSSAIIAEVRLTDLFTLAQPKQFVPLPKYPAVEEDLSLLVDETKQLGPVLEQIASSQPFVETIAVVEVYRHPSLGEHKKSPLIHLAYRKPDGTLSANEVAEVRQHIIATLTKEDIHVRE